jgi:hypothetical protein
MRYACAGSSFGLRSSFFCDETPDAGWRTIEGVMVGDKVGEDEGDEEADELNGRAGMMSEFNR